MLKRKKLILLMILSAVAILVIIILVLWPSDGDGETPKSIFTKDDTKKTTFIKPSPKTSDVVDVVINSNPLGALVSIDDKSQGVTPVSTTLPKSLYNLSIQKTGFYDESIRLDLINKTDSVQLDIELRPIPRLLERLNRINIANPSLVQYDNQDTPLLVYYNTAATNVEFMYKGEPFSLLSEELGYVSALEWMDSKRAAVTVGNLPENMRTVFIDFSNWDRDTKPVISIALPNFGFYFSLSPQGDKAAFAGNYDVKTLSADLLLYNFSTGRVENSVGLKRLNVPQDLYWGLNNKVAVIEVSEEGQEDKAPDLVKYDLNLVDLNTTPWTHSTISKDVGPYARISPDKSKVVYASKGNLIVYSFSTGVSTFLDVPSTLNKDGSFAFIDNDTLAFTELSSSNSKGIHTYNMVDGSQRSTRLSFLDIKATSDIVVSENFIIVVVDNKSAYLVYSD